MGMKKNDIALLEGYKLYLFTYSKDDEYINRYNYIKMNILEEEYVFYGVAEKDHLIMKLANLYKIDKNKNNFYYY
jgi:hypothetical protein